MRSAEIARNVQQGRVNESDIDDLIQGVVSQDGARWSDEEVVEVLQSIFKHGLDSENTGRLTSKMMHSGEILSWPEEWRHLVVDKHSTGGVGDKVSIPLAPALAACGLKVPMISGRGLGHTGGTLDKLESIPGFNVQLPAHRIQKQIAEIGIAMVGQTGDLVPADRRMYALRDVTGTVASLPLITSSIVSKKAAENLSALVLDVKYGRAAFMTEREDAVDLAKAMVSAATHCGIHTRAILTTMNRPLGSAIGNAIEIVESIETLRGNGPSDLEELVCAQGGALLEMTGLVDDFESGSIAILDALHDGSALERFIEMAVSQGVNSSIFESEYTLYRSLGLLDSELNETEIHCGSDGYILDIDALALALVALDLGAGRKGVKDTIDHAVGILVEVDIGESMTRGQTWVTIHHRGVLSKELITRIQNSLTIGNKKESESRIDTWIG
mgnify:FL=1